MGRICLHDGGAWIRLVHAQLLPLMKRSIDCSTAIGVLRCYLSSTSTRTAICCTETRAERSWRTYSNLFQSFRAIFDDCFTCLRCEIVYTSSLHTCFTRSPWNRVEGAWWTSLRTGWCECHSLDSFFILQAVSRTSATAPQDAHSHCIDTRQYTGATIHTQKDTQRDWTHEHSICVAYACTKRKRTTQPLRWLFTAVQDGRHRYSNRWRIDRR